MEISPTWLERWAAVGSSRMISRLKAALPSENCEPESIIALIERPLMSASTMVSWPDLRRAGTTTLPRTVSSCRDLVISKVLPANPMTSRWPFSQSIPSTPSMSKDVIGSTGAWTFLRTRVPISSRSSTTLGRPRAPTIVCTRSSRPAGRASLSASSAETQETLAPVSTMKR